MVERVPFSPAASSASSLSRSCISATTGSSVSHQIQLPRYPSVNSRMPSSEMIDLPCSTSAFPPAGSPRTE